MEYYTFKLKFQIGHTDGLSRQIPKNTEPLEKTLLALLKEEKELSGLLINTIQELLVTLTDIRKAAEMDGFIQQIKKQVSLNGRNERTKMSPFSICDQTLMYADRVVMPHSLQKKNSKSFTQAFWVCLVCNP